MHDTGHARPEIAANLPVFVRQPNGGALYRGGVPGHRGGPGRPALTVRRLCLGSFAQRIRGMEESADDERARPADRIRALEALAKYGLGGQDAAESSGVTVVRVVAERE